MVSTPFPQAAGHGNFPNGVFSPDLFAQEALYYFRQLSIIDEITTSEYNDQIESLGDTVHIRTQPKVTVKTYTRGGGLDYQDLNDAETILKIDQANFFAHKLDSIMMKQADIDYSALVADSAAYELRDKYDRDVMQFMVDGATENTQGASGSELTIGFGGGNDFTPVDALNRLDRILTEENIPSTGRWLVMNPAYLEVLGKEKSTLIEANTMGDSQSALRDKGLLMKPIHGFTTFVTNNLPGADSGEPILLAGHTCSTATATQLIENEMLRDPNDFGDLYRGLQVYGREVIRPSALVKMHITIGDVA